LVFKFTYYKTTKCKRIRHRNKTHSSFILGSQRFFKPHEIITGSLQNPPKSVMSRGMKKLNNNNFGIFRICFVDSLLSEELGQLVGGVRALDVLPGADLGLLVGAGQSSELVLSAGMDGVDSSLSVLEELDNTGLIGVQFIDGFSDNMADQKFATVSQVDGGNGIEKDVHLGRPEGGGLGITTSTASAKFGQDKAFSAKAKAPMEATATATWAPVRT
jgi:hypothetical protein